MRIRVVLNDDYHGVTSGGALRYVNLISELATSHDLTVFLPSGGDRLRNDVSPEIHVVSCNVGTKVVRSRQGALSFFLSLLSPTRENITLPNYRYYPELEHLLSEDHGRYEGEIYFDLSAIVNYGICRRSASVVCDLCDSKLRALSTQQRYAHSVFQRVENYFSAQYIRRIKRRLIPRNVILTAVTETDCVFIRSVLPDNRVVSVPNGVHLPGCEDTPEAISRKLDVQTMIFVGTLSFPPNEDAVDRLIRGVWPIVKTARPGTKLLVVGRHPSATVRGLVSDAPDVTMLADVESVYPYLSESSVAIYPVFKGAGIKNKVLEALAQGTPVVATEESVVGIAMRDGVHGLLGNTERELAARAIELLDMPLGAYTSLCRNARELARAYSWASSAGKLLHLLRPGS